VKNLAVKKIILKVISAFFSIYFLYCGIIYIQLFISSRYLKDLKPQELLRFKIYGFSYNDNDTDNTISATFSLTDANGNEFAIIERSWKGNYLALNFKQLKIGKSIYFFPISIYGKKNIIESKKETHKVIKLSKYYNEDFKCLFLPYNFPEIQQKNLFTLSAFTTGFYKIPTFYFVKNKRIDLSDCKTGIYYTISQNYNNDLILNKF